MQNPGESGKKSIKEIEDPRAGKAKLESVSSTLNKHKKADDLDKACAAFEKTFDAIEDCIMILDGESKIIAANPATSRCLGKPVDEIIRKRCWEVIHSTVQPRKECLLQQMRITKRREESELYLHEKDVWLHVSVDPIPDDQGNVNCAVHIIRDITERKKAQEALQESEERFRTLFESTREGVVTADSDGRIVSTNPAAATMLGYKNPQDLIGMYTAEFYADPKQREIVLKELMEKDYVEDFEIIAKKRDGTRAYILISITTQRDEEGDILRTNGIFRDISDYKRAEIALRDSEEKYRLLFETSANPTTILDRDGIIIMLNGTGARNLELTQEQYIGKSIFDIYPGLDRSRIEEFRRIIDTGKSEIREEYHTLPVGRRCFSSILTPVSDENGNIHAVQVISYDITECKMAEEALRESEELYRAIVEQAADSIVLINAETGELLEFNDTAYENLGYTREEFGKLKIPDFECVESAENVAKHIEKIIREGRDTFETKHRTKDGRIRDVQVSSRAISIGGRDFVQSIWRDVTERKRAEDERREYQARLKAMASKLSSIQERQRRQLAVELHDRITQRLAMIKLGLETAVGSFEGTDAARKVKDIAKQVGRTMEDAYALMLDLSNPVLYEIGLKAAVDTLLQSDLVKRCGITCRLVAPGEYMKIEIDVRVALYQATRELLVNAIKYSKAKQIEVHLSRTQDAAAVRVKDDGIGFDTSVVKLPGKQGGFGLFNIRENIGGIGGDFTIESKPGKGTSAKVWVPMPQEDLPTEEGGSNENTHRR